MGVAEGIRCREALSSRHVQVRRGLRELIGHGDAEVEAGKRWKTGQSSTAITAAGVSDE